MDAFNDPLLAFWRSFGDWGFKIVILGVIGEVFAATVDFISEKCCKKWHNKRKRLLRLVELLSGAILISGLAMEYKGHKQETLILDSYNGQSYLEAKQAEKKAEDAKLFAAHISLQTELLRSNNIMLETKLAQRQITPEQETNFIFLTEKIKNKIPIHIWTTPQGWDSDEYGFQMMQMLTNAGFPAPSPHPQIGSLVSAPWGAEEELDGEIVYPIGISEDLPDVIFLYYGTNNIIPRDPIRYEIINGFTRPIYDGTDVETIYQAIEMCFTNIGITVQPGLKGGWVQPRQGIIFIPANR